MLNYLALRFNGPMNLIHRTIYVDQLFKSCVDHSSASEIYNESFISAFSSSVIQLSQQPERPIQTGVYHHAFFLIQDEQGLQLQTTIQRLEGTLSR